MPDNDKTTVAKVGGSDNDEEKITTNSGTTQQFNSEYFARIPVEKSLLHICLIISSKVFELYCYQIYT